MLVEDSAKEFMVVPEKVIHLFQVQLIDLNL